MGSNRNPNLRPNQTQAISVLSRFMAGASGDVAGCDPAWNGRTSWRRLAYHGARAQDASFNIILEREFDPGLTPTELAPQATASPRSRVATFNVGRKVRGSTVALPLGSRVEAIAKQVQEYPGHLCILSDVDHPGSAAHSRKRSF